jgi:predicted ATPase/class 3 adenylate cyclase
MPTLPTGTVTFLFTDIEGSTTRWEHHSAAMHAALARHDGLLRDAIEVHDGVVFKTVGDAFCAVFTAAPAALEAALTAQRALAAEPWPEELGAVRVRMALHTGTAEQRGADYFGPPLNRVARLRSAGHGGQVLLSAATYELVRDALPAGAGLRDLGEHRLKDLIRPEQVYQLTAPDLPAQFPMLRTLDSRANNLPVQQTSFIGRERELAAVRALLERPDVHMVTLTGPGGTGKTRLAVQAAAAALAGFADGTYFVPLAPVSDPALVASTLAQMLGLQEAGGQPLQEALLGYLRDKEMLLLLDNFEQVVAAAPLVSTLLAGAPRLTLLVTSRTVLRLYGEREYAVPPLALPTLHHLPEVAALTQYEAVALFIQRARLAKADFAVTQGNALAVAEICVRLDGLPLAIELAAARIKMLPLGALLTRLQSRLSVLTGGARDLPARQQTLRGAIDWSYRLLDAGEQTLFTWLSVFVGGCTLEAVEAVCARAGGLPVEVLDGLTSLVDKSLVRLEEDPRRGEPRFLMLETLQEYAGARLAQSGAEGAVRAAHAAHVLALVEEAEPHLTGADQERWMDRLDGEHDNLRAALRWAQESSLRQEMGLRIAGGVWRLWYVRGHLSEGRRWLEALLGGRAAQEPSVAAAAVRAKALNAAGSLAWVQSDYVRATVLHEESLALYRDLGDRSGIATALNNLGNVAWAHGDYAGATVLYEESLTLRRDLGDTWGSGAALNNLGSVAQAQGDYARATVLHEESLALRRDLSDTWGIVTALNNLGHVARAQGAYARARELYAESLPLGRQLGHMGGIANALSGLGRVAMAQDDYARARELYAESLPLFRAQGDKQGLVSGLEEVARVATDPDAAPGALERAARVLGMAAALRATIGLLRPPNERAAYDATAAALRAALGDARYEASWEEGQALTLEQAVALAMGDLAPPN